MQKRTSKDVNTLQAMDNEERMPFACHSHIPYWEHGSGGYAAHVTAVHRVVNNALPTVIKAIGKFSLDFVHVLHFKE